MNPKEVRTEKRAVLNGKWDWRAVAITTKHKQLALKLGRTQQHPNCFHKREWNLSIQLAILRGGLNPIRFRPPDQAAMAVLDGTGFTCCSGVLASSAMFPACNHPEHRALFSVNSDQLALNVSCDRDV